MNRYSQIIGTGSYLPERILTNHEIAEKTDTSDEWIRKRVGVVERRIIGESGDTTTTMSYEAAKAALAAADLDASELDMIVVGTATADNYFPSTACVVSRLLGIEHDCPAFDLNAACSGFIYALSIADNFIKTGLRNVLVIGVDSLTKLVDWTDRSTCVLFGDGAGAVVLQANEERGIVKTVLHANGKYDTAIQAQNPIWNHEAPMYLTMRGNEVFRIAVTKLGEIVDEVLALSGFDKSDIDWLIPHQANLRIIQATAKRLGLSMDQVVLTVDRHGNTSAASIPLALDHAVRSGDVKRGQRLLLEAFGAGLAWGAAIVDY